jgi:hypothetical protein
MEMKSLIMPVSERQLFVIGLIILAAIAIVLTGCASTSAVQDRVVEVKVPVAVQPIRADQVPAAPAPLPPRPPTVQQATDMLLSKWCEAVAYVLKADPLLHISAGEKPRDLPKFPECEGG